MKTNGKTAIFFLLTVALLLIISARASPDPPPMERAEERYENYASVVPVSSISQLLPELTKTEWNVRLVSDVEPLPERDEPPHLASIRGGLQMDSRAASALERMLSAAEEAGYAVTVLRAYVPYATQSYDFLDKVSEITLHQNVTSAQAESLARQSVEYPGASEHQTGLAVDIDGGDDEDNANALLQWLAANCAEYGFIQRYPPEKEELTGRNEPWHFRYVGSTVAEFMGENELSLEELVQTLPQYVETAPPETEEAEE